ncbi:hypothetical protein GUJ93_ZPchr0010g8542 [Zizania palustris]|uniref:Uncharacterized protein n=1 Tax=Zizania palustris TaxID=103762 RepID=A0A8J6BNC6_ZIZPA|nr:hypothetical protein GUJ93_ZPchr0010g8542 [Zizania palustris]
MASSSTSVVSGLAYRLEAALKMRLGLSRRSMIGQVAALYPMNVFHDLSHAENLGGNTDGPASVSNVTALGLRNFFGALAGEGQDVLGRVELAGNGAYTTVWVGRRPRTMRWPWGSSRALRWAVLAAASSSSSSGADSSSNSPRSGDEEKEDVVSREKAASLFLDEEPEIRHASHWIRYWQQIYMTWTRECVVVVEAEVKTRQMWNFKNYLS